MPSSTASTNSVVRRMDRAIYDDFWIATFLKKMTVGVLATVYDGQPFLNTNLFVYDGSRHVIFLHTARTGRTRGNLEYNERVCFTTSEVGRLLPADTALEFSIEYASVVVFGRGCVVQDLKEARDGLQLLLDKYAPHLHPNRDYRAITDEELKQTAVYRIDIEEWSGKKNSAEVDFPGAYHFGTVLRGEEELE